VGLWFFISITKLPCQGGGDRVNLVRQDSTV